jgi:glycosyltransferase involved in cell wall biosynthesis
LPEVVRVGETGALCTVGDTDGMAREAYKILSVEERLRAMGERAAADARERFSRDMIVPQYEALYVDAVQAVG